MTENNIFTVLNKALENPNLNPSILEKLISFQESLDKKNAEIAFNEDLAKLQPELPTIKTSGKNLQTKSKYAKLIDINSEIVPIIAKHGFSISFEIINQSVEQVTVKTILRHIKGHSQETCINLPIDTKSVSGTKIKTDIHGIGSTITYARRYGLCALLNISFSEDDIDGNLPNSYITEAEADMINNELDKLDSDKIKFCSFMKVESINKIYSKDLGKALLAIKSKEKKGQKND